VPFKPGQPRPKNAGLKKGGITRDKLSMREFLNEHNINVIEQFLARVAKVQDPDRQAQLFALMFPYVYPKLSSVEVKQRTEIQMKLDAMSPQEILTEAKRLLLTKGETIDGEFTANGNGKDKEGISNALHNTGGDLTTAGRLAIEVTRDQEED